MYKEGLANLQIQILIFETLWFLKNEKFDAGARPKLQIFWNWTPKNKPDQQKHVGLQKSKKSAKSLHPTVHSIGTRPDYRSDNLYTKDWEHRLEVITA